MHEHRTPWFIEKLPKGNWHTIKLLRKGFKLMEEKRRITHLERAKADLKIVQNNLPLALHEVDVDICAYHCQQCIENVIKHIAISRGQDYDMERGLHLSITDLDLPDVVPLVQPYVDTLDAWISTVQRRERTWSKKKVVEEIKGVCEAIVALADGKTKTGR